MIGIIYIFFIFKYMGLIGRWYRVRAGKDKGIFRLELFSIGY